MDIFIQDVRTASLSISVASVVTWHRNFPYLEDNLIAN